MDPVVAGGPCGEEERNDEEPGGEAEHVLPWPVHDRAHSHTATTQAMSSAHARRLASITSAHRRTGFIRGEGRFLVPSMSSSHP